MTASGYFSIMDRSRERSAFSFLTGDVTAVSLPGLLTQFGALRTATDAIILGVIQEEAQYVFKTKLSNSVPVDPNAQRERKWLVTYEDTTQLFDDPVNAIPNAGYRKVFNIEIPTADASLLPTDIETDFVSLAQAAIAPWVTAFEAIARSPYGGDVNVLTIEMVGRNL
jgi:hypothetical protein